MNTRQ